MQIIEKLMIVKIGCALNTYLKVTLKKTQHTLMSDGICKHYAN